MEDLIDVREPLESFLAELMFQVGTWKESQRRQVLLDFRRVDFIDSMAIGHLVRLYLECKRQGIQLRTVNVASIPRRSLVHAGVTELLGLGHQTPPDIDDSTETAW
ncbi:STAS domain-containing protein [bacterium]|nr:STAS domain-containing protein [bacterium]